LTTKFTRYTAASPPPKCCHSERSEESAFLSSSTTSSEPPRAEQFHGPMSLLIACPTFSVSRPSRVTSGTHKNLRRLVYCPIYSVVKYRPRELAFT